jgi:hypothetical protein
LFSDAFPSLNPQLAARGARRARWLLRETEFAVELVHAPAGVNQLLFPRVKRMALRADFDLDVLLCAARFDYLTTGAPNGSLLVIGMKPFLH